MQNVAILTTLHRKTILVTYWDQRGARVVTRNMKRHSSDFIDCEAEHIDVAEGIVASFEWTGGLITAKHPAQDDHYIHIFEF